MIIHRTPVAPEWVDYNGHLRDAYYLLIFSHASDALMDAMGLDAAGRAASGTRCSPWSATSTSSMK